ncbi:hypothetical protein LEMLEM_LOCUS22354 [Lemmus lemmus]
MWIELCCDKKRCAINNSRSFDLHDRKMGTLSTGAVMSCFLMEKA